MGTVANEHSDLGPVMVEDLRRYLSTMVVTQNNIGNIRRCLFLPFDSKWNGIVRDETAAVEQVSN